MKKRCSVVSFITNAIPKSIRLLLTAVLLVFSNLGGSNVFAQSAEKTISGVVADVETGEPIPGVSIAIKGNAGGTITDLDGKFTLKVLETDVLNLTAIGFKAQKVTVAGKELFDIQMSIDVALFDELVVIGYGVQKKKLVTGATVQVKGGDLEKRSTTNALQALQGQAAGVQISNTSGQPGEGLRVVIRGAGTIGNANPLYVVDGIQTGDISYLNNADIESIDVLKDAASAAIYGSQAANGVVLITTRSGKKGKAQVSLDAYYGFQNAPRKVDMLNSEQYAVIMNETAINSGKAPSDFSEYKKNSTDWMDQMLYDNAITQNYNIGISGGSDVSVYSMSLSYTGQEGIVGGPSASNYDRYNFRINTEHKLYGNFLKVGQNLTFGYIEKNGISVGNQYNNSLRGAYNTSPFLPVYDDEGNFLDNTKGSGAMYQGQDWEPWAEGESNPYASMMYNNQSENNNQKMLGNVYFEINPIENLKFKTTLGVDYYANEERSYKPIYQLSIYDLRINDEAYQSFEKGLALTLDNVLTYDFTIDDHAISLMAGSSIYQNKGTWLNVKNTNLVTSDLEHAYINNTTNTNLATLSYGGGPNDEDKRLSYFGRLGYNYKEKYMINATFRRDGSSRFNEDHRWGNFPSVSGGWVMTNETFTESTRNWLDFFKIRASWGQVGNQNIEAWQYLAPIKTENTNYYFGSADFDASGNTVGAYPNRLGNPTLIWETSEQTNVGFDSRFLSSRLGVVFDWYNKSTEDWLLVPPGSATIGADAPFINGGKVTNKGVELAVTWNDNIGEFRYYVSVNASKNTNKVTEVPAEGGIVHGLENMLYDNSPEFYRRAETGFPIGYFWGWKTDGIFQNEAEIAAHTNSDGDLIQPNAQPGDVRYQDLDDNGVIDDDDKTMVGDPNPDYNFGISLGFDYKGFDFSVAGSGVAGNQLVQSYRNHSNATANYTTEVLGRWHGEGTSNSIPRVTETNINYQFSDLYIKDGDFFRITNITLGYDFSNLFQYQYLGQCRVYASVQNAFTFTKYNGMDPEVGYGLEDGSAGVDLGYYPQPRTFLVGINVKF